MPKPQNTTLPDRIPSDYADPITDRMKNVFADKLKSDETRDWVTKVVCDYAESVPFMKKVKEYASEEIDSKTFQNIKFWFTTIIIPIIVSILTLLLINNIKFK